MINSKFSQSATVKKSAKYRKRALALFAFFIVSVISLNGQTAAEMDKSADELGNQWKKESLQSAVELYRKSAGEWDKTENFEKAADSLLEAGRLLLIVGDNDSAVQTFHEAAKIAVSHNLTAQKSKSESSLALVFQKTGDLDKSKKYLAAASIFDRKSTDKTARALFFFASAEHLYLEHKYDEALSFYIQSSNLWSELGDLRRYGETCIYTAYTFFAAGNLNQGLVYTAEAERTFSATGNRRGLALSQIAGGHILSSLNRKQEALGYYSKANQNFPDDLDLLEKGAMLNGFGAIYEYYGDFESSLKYRLNALNAFKKDNYLDGQMATMHSIIGLNFRLDNIPTAESFIREAERLSKILHDTYYIALVYRVIGDNFFELKQDQKATSFYLRSLTNKTGIGSKTNYILIQNKLGRIYLRANQTSLAEKHFNLSLSESIRSKNYFVQAENYFYLAQLEHTLKNDGRSLEFAKKSVEISDNLNSDVLSSKLKQKYFSSVYNRYELYINLLMQSREQPATESFALSALQASEKSRARSMLENLSLSEANFTKDADVETIKKEKEIRVALNAKADKLTDLLSVNADKGETDKLDDEIHELDHELEDIKANLKQNSPVYSAIKNPAPFDVAAFQRDVLDENSLLLEFSFGADASYLWAVGKTEFNAFVLPPREQIESRIEKLRELTAAREIKSGESVEDFQARIVRADGDYNREAKILSGELFGQIADKLAGKRLIIVPDGKLRYFPVAALPLPDSADDQPILLTNETVYQPSAATLALINGGENQKASKDLLVFSDPIFSRQDARIVAANGGTNAETATAQTEKYRFAESLTNLARLDASKYESDSIVEIVGTSGSTVFSGADANRENALDASIADYKIIHFAAHGFLDETRPELSGIVLSQIDAHGADQNGVVRLQDIYALNLSADLVVLSACSTGIGKEIKGEGLMSLNNAFLQTGAKTVVSSLWKVDDEATRELMKVFYREMSSGSVSTSEALRQAQISLRRNPQYRSPFYWAAFTAEGDFKNAPKIFNHRNHWLYAILIVPFAVFGIYVYRRRNGLFERKVISEN